MLSLVARAQVWLITLAFRPRASAFPRDGCMPLLPTPFTWTIVSSGTTACCMSLRQARLACRRPVPKPRDKCRYRIEEVGMGGQ